MDAAQYAEVLRRLGSALSQIGLTVEEGVRRDGRIDCWERVSTERLLARWLTMAWCVRIVPADLGQLRLVPSQDGTVNTEDD